MNVNAPYAVEYLYDAQADPSIEPTDGWFIWNRAGDAPLDGPFDSQEEAEDMAAEYRARMQDEEYEWTDTDE